MTTCYGLIPSHHRDLTPRGNEPMDDERVRLRRKKRKLSSRLPYCGVRRTQPTIDYDADFYLSFPFSFNEEPNSRGEVGCGPGT